MLVAGVAVAAGIVPFVFPVLALYLWAVVAWDVVGWPAQLSWTCRRRRLASRPS